MYAFRVVFANDIITPNVGFFQDATCCVWSYEGQILHKFKGHKVKVPSQKSISKYNCPLPSLKFIRLWYESQSLPVVFLVSETSSGIGVAQDVFGKCVIKGKSIWSLATNESENAIATGGGDTSLRVWHLHGNNKRGQMMDREQETNSQMIVPPTEKVRYKAYFCHNHTQEKLIS